MDIYSDAPVVVQSSFMLLWSSVGHVTLRSAPLFQRFIYTSLLNFNPAHTNSTESCILMKPLISSLAAVDLLYVLPNQFKETNL